jgi:hypothetical protein
MSNTPTTLSIADDTLQRDTPQLDTLQLNDVEQRTPTLITEQQVRFSTAAALSAPTRQPTRNARAVAAMRRMFALSLEASRPARRHQPRRYSFLEDALMGREMDRL